MESCCLHENEWYVVVSISAGGSFKQFTRADALVKNTVVYIFMNTLKIWDWKWTMSVNGCLDNLTVLSEVFVIANNQHFDIPKTSKLLPFYSNKTMK